jgi:preprotein translocase subunit Sss1
MGVGVTGAGIVLVGVVGIRIRFMNEPWPKGMWKKG